MTSDPHDRWRWPVLVRCPRCSGCATVAGGDGAPIRMTCAGCELIQLRGRIPRAVAPPPDHDEFFGAPLWLRTECCGGRPISARNPEHLEHLRTALAEERREPDVPAWMWDAEHRDEVLRQLDRLRGGAARR